MTGRAIAQVRVPPQPFVLSALLRSSYRISTCLTLPGKIAL